MKRLALTLGLLACDDAPRPGSVEVQWLLAERTCEGSAIESVEALLFDYSSAEPVARERAACLDGALTVDEVAPGRYALVLVGLEAGDCATHEARSDAVLVEAGETTRLAPLALTRRPRTLDVRWLPDGRACADIGVSQVAVEVWVNGQADRRVPAICETGHAMLPDVPPGALEVRVVGFDASGVAIAAGNAGDAAPGEACGGVTPIEVALEICFDPGC